MIDVMLHFLKVIDLLDSNENNSNGSSNSKILLSSSKNNGKLLSASSSSTATNTTTTSTNNNITRDDDDSIRNSNIKVVQISNSCAKAGDDVYCIHNPYDWDLELAQGARPRRNGFNPFTISPGDIDGYMDDDDDKSTAWMFGNTPPAAIVTPPISLFNSSSLRTANWMCRGMIRLFLLSRAALPANSKISAHKYSNTAAMYTGAPAPILAATRPCLM